MEKTTRRHPNVVNIAGLKASGIGCSYYEVPPGRTAFPNHYHCANEELIYVLEGMGSLRIGADEVQVGPGDYATFPIGPAHTHQLLNSGAAPLLYQCVSTLLPTEVVGYPDSQKIGAFSYTAAGESMVRIMVREESKFDYYDRES